MDERKKALVNEYKQRKIVGGIYIIKNKLNNMYLLDSASDIQAKLNSFEFMVSSGSCFHYKIKKDWESFSSQAFSFKILETL